MRELKFRMYDSQLLKMSHRPLLPYDNEHPDITVMQFTGLKDRKGIDIYEGDIIKFVGGTCSSLSMNHYGKSYSIGAILKVSNLLSGFTLQDIKSNMDAPNLVGNVSNYDFWNHQRSLEVVGNIHENPELLK